MKSFHPSLVLAVVTCCALAGNAAPPGAVPAQRPELDEISMTLEVDLPGGAAEIELEIESETGLAKVVLLDRAGEPLAEIAAAQSGGFQVKELVLQASGASASELLLEHAPGPYLVRATTLDGALVHRAVALARELPGRFRVVEPASNGVLRRDAARIAWEASRGAARYLLEIERDSGEPCLEVVLPPSCTSFTVPSIVLEAGGAYDYSLSVRGDTDNELEVEGSFRVVE